MIQQGRAIKATVEKRATLIRVDAICVADVLSQIRRRKMDSIVRGGTFRFEDATRGGDTPRSDEIEIAGQGSPHNSPRPLRAGNNLA